MSQLRFTTFVLLTCLIATGAVSARQPKAAPSLKKVPSGWQEEAKWTKSYSFPEMKWEKKVNKNTDLTFTVLWRTGFAMDPSEKQGHTKTLRAHKEKFLTSWTPTTFAGMNGFERTATVKLWPGKDKSNTKKAASFRREIFLPQSQGAAEGYLIRYVYSQKNRTSFIAKNPKPKDLKALLGELVLAPMGGS